MLGCRRRANSIVIEVWDTGLGIPEEKLQEIFQEFRRLRPQDPSRDKGLGLGLAIVDKISRVLEHPIRVRSTEGKGSVFSVEVPLGELALFSEIQGPRMQEAPNGLNGADIWVIDNERAICQGMHTLLSGWGCNVVTALSLEDLLSKVDPRHDPVDMLIADYHLDDDQNGVDAARGVAKLMDTPLNVLMITANYNKELKQDIRELGYFLMNKPVKPLKLKTTLLHLLKDRNAQ
nr:ATP-binding protein [Neptunomonas phycophila]